MVSSSWEHQMCCKEPETSHLTGCELFCMLLGWKAAGVPGGWLCHICACAVSHVSCLL